MTEFTPKPGPLPRFDQGRLWNDFYVEQLEKLMVACRGLEEKEDEFDDITHTQSFKDIHDCMVVLGMFDHEVEE